MALNVKKWETHDHPFVTYPVKSLTLSSSSSNKEDVLLSDPDRDLVKRDTQKIIELAKKRKDELDIF